MTIEQLAERHGLTAQTYAQRLLDDLPFFVEEIFHDRGIDKFAPIGWVERDMLNWVQHGPIKQGVLAPRSFGKTHLITAGVTCWDLLHDPDAKIQIVSKTEGEAKKTIGLIRRWIAAVPFLQHLRPEARPGRRHAARDTTSYFDVGPARDSRDASVTAKGITGQVTGTRASRTLADDVETPENTQTVEAREALRNKVDEFTAITTYGDRRINYIGTFHHEESLYIAEQSKGTEFRSWPELYPTTDQQVFQLAPEVQRRLEEGHAQPGDIVADYRFDRDWVIDRQSRGATWYAMQCMLLANLGDKLRYPLRLEQLIVFESMNRDQCPVSIVWGKNNGQGQPTRLDHPCLGFRGDGLYRPVMFSNDWTNYTGTKMWIDPAKGQRGGDQIGYAIVAHGAGHLWAKAAGGLADGTTEDNLVTLANLARHHGATEIHVEDIGLQSFLANLLEPVVRRLWLEPGESSDYPNGWKASVIATRPPLAQSQKEVRIISALEGVMNTHRLVVSPQIISVPDGVEQTRTLQYQLTRITRQRQCLPADDQIESLANAVALWQDTISQDPAQAAEFEREQQLERQLAEFMADPIGRDNHTGIFTPAKTRWFQHH